MLTLYNVVLYLALPVVLLRLLVRSMRNPAYLQRWGERFGFVPPTVTAVDLWVHAVSVGEVRAAAPLVKAIQQQRIARNVLVTTMTPTGSDEVIRALGQDVKHCYVPYDYPGAVARFLDVVRPRLAITMETEMWPNIVRACRARGIPFLFVNVRMSPRSFQRYQRVGGMMRTLLSQVDALAVQSDDVAQRLTTLGADPARIHVTGSIKFELEIPASLTEVAQVLRREWGQDRPVWIAGSTHEGEDEIILKAHAQLCQRHPQLLLVLVPRHPERFAAVARAAQRAGFEVARRSESTARLPESVAVYLGDTMGELSLLYAASDIAFVGGSLVPKGGQNILEAFAAGVPVVFGPHMFNFLEISELALEARAARQVPDGSALTAAVDDFLKDPNLRYKAAQAGRALIEQNKGALGRTLDVIRSVLDARRTRR